MLVALVQLKIKSEASWEVLQSEDQTGTRAKSLRCRVDFPKFSTAHSLHLCLVFKASWAICRTSFTILWHSYWAHRRKNSMCVCLHVDIRVCAHTCTCMCVSSAEIYQDIQAFWLYLNQE